MITRSRIKLLRLPCGGLSFACLEVYYWFYLSFRRAIWRMQKLQQHRFFGAWRCARVLYMEFYR